VKLLLDEMYTASLAERLRTAGIAATTVAELGAAGGSDPDVFAAAVTAVTSHQPPAVVLNGSRGLGAPPGRRLPSAHTTRSESLGGAQTGDRSETSAALIGRPTAVMVDTMTRLTQSSRTILMRQVTNRRPSGPMAVAVVALIVALSGTAVAASRLLGGDKLIKVHSLSGNRLRNHTVTGRQIKLSTLGTVPRARHADDATHAQTADSAATATSAASATNANHAATADSATNSNAVSGNSVTKLFFHGAGGATPVQVYNTDGLLIRAGCDDPGDRVVALATGNNPQNQGQLDFHVFTGSTLYSEELTGLGTSVHGLTASKSNGSGGLTYSTPDGEVVTIEYGFSTNDPDGGCTFAGIATASS
jgi:hypothetical protein